jgi:hypothetical protein
MFLFLLFFIFLYLRLFLVKRHKTFFGFGFQILFFGLVILFFWFWVLVKCKKWFIFCIWFCFFIYFILYWLTPGLPLFYLAPYFIRSPPFIQSVKTNVFLFVIHSLLILLLLLLLLLLNVLGRSVVCSYLQNVLDYKVCTLLYYTHTHIWYKPRYYLCTHLFYFSLICLLIILKSFYPLHIRFKKVCFMDVFSIVFVYFDGCTVVYLVLVLMHIWRHMSWSF